MGLGRKLYLPPIEELDSFLGMRSVVGLLMSSVEEVSLFVNGGCVTGLHVFSASVLVSDIYHFELGQYWSQCPDFDHSIKAVKFAVVVGQKWGVLPYFDHRLNHEDWSVGQLRYLVPVCDFHQRRLRWDRYI